MQPGADRWVTREVLATRIALLHLCYNICFHIIPIGALTHKEREIRLAVGTLISLFYLARFKLRLLAKEGVTGRYKQQEKEDGVNSCSHVLCFLAHCSLLKIYGVGLSLSGRKEI